MIRRDEHLQVILDKALMVIAGRGDDRTRRAADRVFGRLSRMTGEVRSDVGSQLAVCGYLSDITAGMAQREMPLPEIGQAFAALEGQLGWWRRKGVSAMDQPFYDGHANAMLIGPGGLEQREDVMVGVSLMAPAIQYPDHSHAPEEVYLAFTEGEWWNSDMEWTEPGPGGLIYNPPGILHAMRSGSKPFLALWLLPID